MNFKFANRLDPLFECVIDVLDRSEQGLDPDYQEARDAIIAELQRLDLTLGQSEIWKNDWSLARYAMIAWIDEVLVHGCAWDEADRWSDDLLEVELTGIAPEHAGSEFFERARQAAETSCRDALEVFYLTVVLGFRGSWRHHRNRDQPDKVSPKLKEWLTTTFESLMTEPATTPLPIHSDPAPTAEPLNGRSQLLNVCIRLLMLASLAAVLLPTLKRLGSLSAFASWATTHWLLTMVTAAVVVAAPLLLKKLIRLRMQKARAGDDDIQAAWDAGLKELKRCGFDLHSIPVYLVVGTPDAEVAQSVMTSSGLPFDVAAVPEGDAALVWFASRQAIFLACPTAGQVSLNGRMPQSDNPVAATAEERAAANFRLQAVCRLLRRIRRPDVGINGLLSFLPQHLITAGDESSVALQSAVAADNRTIAISLQQRAHTIILVGGMEQQPGFLKLVQRFGIEVCERNRIGKGLPSPWCLPAADTMDALVHQACQAVEDNAYQLFRRDHNLEAVGNFQLYRLVCLSRHRLCDRLSDVVRHSYAGSEAGAEFCWPVSGCYFAATGQRADEQAFTVSVFRKLMQCSKLVDWNSTARETNAVYERISRMLQLTTVLIAVILFALILISTGHVAE
ncbi:MAG: DotU family type IV/VI secretion system protein [Planctomycetaceae bacterium]